MDDKPLLLFFPFSIRTWRMICADLDGPHRAALWELVARYSERGFLPHDDRSLSTIARVSMSTWRRGMRSRLVLKFPQEGWRWPEIDQAIQRRQKTSGKKSAAGAKGNVVRWSTWRNK